MWRRWKAGESLHEIGPPFGKDHWSIQFLLSKRGGSLAITQSCAIDALLHIYRAS
jgi:hypothetical protein